VPQQEQTEFEFLNKRLEKSEKCIEKAVDCVVDVLKHAQALIHILKDFFNENDYTRNKRVIS
jgi:hypothetical protein